MNEDPLFTVVIPTRDRPEMVSDAVRSVLAQTVTDFECLVVDDGGTVPPPDIDDARVRVITRATSGGPAAARNSGAATARGRYLTFLDDDDEWGADRLALALDGLVHAPVALCWARFDDEDEEEVRGRELCGDVSAVILDDITPHLGATAIETGAFQPFDERYLACEDVEWWLRTSRTLAVHTVPAVGVVLRRHSGTRHGSGAAARIQWSQQLLAEEADYFASHRRARAFRHLRIGLTAMSISDHRLARRHLRRAMCAEPSVRTAAHLARSSLRPLWPRRAILATSS